MNFFGAFLHKKVPFLAIIECCPKFLEYICPGFLCFCFSKDVSCTVVEIWSGFFTILRKRLCSDCYNQVGVWGGGGGVTPLAGLGQSPGGVCGKAPVNFWNFHCISS